MLNFVKGNFVIYKIIDLPVFDMYNNYKCIKYKVRFESIC